MQGCRFQLSFVLLSMEFAFKSFQRLDSVKNKCSSFMNINNRQSKETIVRFDVYFDS